MSSWYRRVFLCSGWQNIWGGSGTDTKLSLDFWARWEPSNCNEIKKIVLQRPSPVCCHLQGPWRRSSKPRQQPTSLGPSWEAPPKIRDWVSTHLSFKGKGQTKITDLLGQEIHEEETGSVVTYSIIGFTSIRSPACHRYLSVIHVRNKDFFKLFLPENLIFASVKFVPVNRDTYFTHKSRKLFNLVLLSSWLTV